MDNYLNSLADTIVNYSLNVSKGEKVLITYHSEECTSFVKMLIEKIISKGGIPMFKYSFNEINSLIMENLNEDIIDLIVKNKEHEVYTYDSIVQIIYNDNDYENKNVSPKMLNLLGEKSREIDNIRINKRKWVLLNYPSKLDAYKAKMTTNDFREYALKAMTADYQKMNEVLKPLKELMEKTDKVRITGPNTDLTFSIKGMPAIICAGEYNIPDGEVYTAPIKDSVNGIITYNTESPYRNGVYKNISLEFKDGKIVKATCDGDNDSLNEIFDTDSGSRFVGEFSLGVNPNIRSAMGDILYDEKICGSIHFTPGTCYENCDNGNISSIHWDLVLIQREEYGGGNIYFDDVLVRKDGIFVKNELKNINFD